MVVLVLMQVFLPLFQELGYKGEIGYQTFLYSSETEIRSLLMFLVEKLPRERAETLDQPTGTKNTCVVLQNPGPEPLT